MGQYKKVLIRVIRSAFKKGVVQDWNEEDHPRDPDGKFGTGAGGGASSSKNTTNSKSKEKENHLSDFYNAYAMAMKNDGEHWDKYYAVATRARENAVKAGATKQELAKASQEAGKLANLMSRRTNS